MDRVCLRPIGIFGDISDMHMTREHHRHSSHSQAVDHITVIQIVVWSLRHGQCQSHGISGIELLDIDDMREWRVVHHHDHLLSLSRGLHRPIIEPFKGHSLDATIERCAVIAGVDTYEHQSGQRLRNPRE